jgi:poly(A) polymerase
MDSSPPPASAGRSLTPRIIPYPIAASRIDQDAAKVVRRLVRHGHAAYLVGGCVRDLLLGRMPKDFDIVTSARPSEVKGLFRNCRVIGRRFRLAHVLFGGGKILEVATFRRDPTLETPGQEDWEDPDRVAFEAGPDEAGAALPVRVPGRPVKDRSEDSDLLIRHDNVFGEPHEDAARRDFTMNALFYDLERQEIVDYVGGLAEIERRVIRTIGEPDVRFREDPVRILRAIKFAARLDLGIEPDVYDAMVAHREDLLRAARPRLLEELLRLLRGGASRRSFWLAWETGVLAVLLPELSSFLDDDPDGRARLWKRLGAIDERVATAETPTDAVLLSALLLEPIEEAVEGERDLAMAVSDYLADLVLRLAIPRRMIDRMRQILAIQRRLRSGRVGSLARRDYYPEAASLYALDAVARGVPEADIQAIVSGREPMRGRRPSQRPPRFEREREAEAGDGVMAGFDLKPFM